MHSPWFPEENISIVDRLHVSRNKEEADSYVEQMLPSVSQFSSGLSPRIRRSSHWLDTPCSLDTPNLDTPSLSSSPVSSGHLSPIHFAGVACIGVDCRHTRAMIDRSSPTPLGTRLSTTDSPACEISQPFDHVADDSNSSSKLTLVGSPARRSKPRPFDLSRTCAVEESDLKVYVPVECPPSRRYSEGYPATSIDVYRHISREYSASLYGHADNGNSMASLVEMVPRGQSGVRGEGREASPSHDTSPVLNTLFPDDENDPVSTGTTAPWRYQSTTDGIHKVPATRSSFDGSAFSRPSIMITSPRKSRPQNSGCCYLSTSASDFTLHRTCSEKVSGECASGFPQI